MFWDLKIFTPESDIYGDLCVTPDLANGYVR